MLLHLNKYVVTVLEHKDQDWDVLEVEIDHISLQKEGQPLLKVVVDKEQKNAPNVHIYTYKPEV